MLCAPDPCECFAPKPKAKAPRKRPVAEGSLPAQQVAPEPSSVGSGPPRQDLRAKMKAAAAQAPTFTPEVIERKQTKRADTELTKAAPAARPLPSDDTLLEHAALRALAPIMHPDEQEHYRMVINSTPSPTERKAEWRARRAWQLQQ